MKITVKPIEIVENELNEVTSDKIFKSRKITDSQGNYLFDDNGIFSETIFGKFNRCKCGKLTEPGICPYCNCRVLNKKNIPNFYIKFGFDIPNLMINYDNVFADKDLVNDLINFRGFLYDGEYVSFNLKDDMSVYDEDRVLFGKDALLSIGVEESWYNDNVHRLTTIPHTSFRKITFHNDKYFVGTLNTLYINMLRLSNKHARLQKNNKLTTLNELNLRFMVCRDLEKLYEDLFMILAKNNHNVIDYELRGQPATGMIRAVITNNFSLDEDEIVVGKYFISTLYPNLYEKYTVNGETDIDKINEEIRTNNYLVLFNRQPTIGAKSFTGMKISFSKDDLVKFIIQAPPIVYDGLAADVDGDALNVIALYTEAACNEALKLLASNNYIEGANSSIRNGLLEEFEYVKSIMEKGV